MKTMNTKLLLPLAALALVTAACDPFPAAPGGDPRVVRVTSTDQSWTFNSVTVENTGSSAGTVTVPGAYPLDAIYVAFNKPMNGLTLQKWADTNTTIPIDPDTIGIQSHPADPGDPAATPAVDPIPAFTDPGKKFAACTVPTNLTLAGFEEVPGVPGVWDMVTHDFVPGTGTYPAKTSVCYYPGSVTDGGQLIITPAVAMVAGVDYKVTGTVNDYEGKALPIDITVRVDESLTATAVDGLAHPGYGVAYAYGLMVDWFPTGATGYTLEWALDAATPAWSAGISIDPATTCGPAYDFGATSSTPIGYTVCEYLLPELPPGTDYVFRLGEGAAPTVWKETAASTRGALPVTLTNFAATGSAVTVPGAIQLAWGRVLPATTWTRSGNVVQPAWIVERAPDVSGAAGTWADITATLTTTAGAPRAVTSTSRSAVDLTATPAGTTFHYRVRPAYTSLVVYEGASAAKTSYAAP
jgi:hypothetical protein